MRSGKVVLVQKVIPPYRVSVFSRLAQLHDVVVCFGRKRRHSNFTVVQAPPFPFQYLKSFYYRDTDTTLIQNLWPLFSRIKPRIVICEFAIGFMSFWKLLALRKLFGYKFVAWTHGITADEMDRPFSSRKSKFKLRVYNKVDAVITYSPLRCQILKDHMKQPEKVFLAQNTLNLEPLINLRDSFEQTGMDVIKAELGFTRKFNLIFIGRLRPEKEIDILIEAFKSVYTQADVELHFVGNGSEEDKIHQAIGQGLPIRFHGPVYGDEESGKLLFASDLLVMPGIVGLSIVHGFAFGVPIITTPREHGGPNHSPEIEFLIDGVNGIYCERENLSTSILQLLADEERLNILKANALRTAREDCSIDNMIRGFSECIAFLDRQ